MAKLRGDLFGSFQGKIGKSYGRIVHGVNIGAVMPPQRGSEKASGAQLDQMQRFSMLGSMASAFINSIRIGLKNAAKNIGPLVSEFDAFVKFNSEAVEVRGGGPRVTYADLIIAKGNLPEVGFASATFTTPGKVGVTWTPNSTQAGADANDKVYVVVYDPESNMSVMSEPTLRSAAAVDVTVPSLWSGVEVHVYGFTVAGGTGNKGAISHSAYIGTGMVG